MSFISIFFITLAGTPPTIVFGSTSFVTTAPAATTTCIRILQENPDALALQPGSVRRVLLRYNRHSDRSGRQPCLHVLELLLTSPLFHKYLFAKVLIIPRFFVYLQPYLTNI